MWVWNQIPDHHGKRDIQQDEGSFNQQTEIKFNEKIDEVLNLEQSFVWCWKVNTSGSWSEIPWTFWYVVLEDREDQLTERVKNE